jgi:hypothetical protein
MDIADVIAEAVYPEMRNFYIQLTLDEIEAFTEAILELAWSKSKHWLAFVGLCLEVEGLGVVISPDECAHSVVGKV